MEKKKKRVSDKWAVRLVGILVWLILALVAVVIQLLLANAKYGDATCAFRDCVIIKGDER